MQWNKNCYSVCSLFFTQNPETTNYTTIIIKNGVMYRMYFLFITNKNKIKYLNKLNKYLNGWNRNTYILRNIMAKKEKKEMLTNAQYTNMWLQL